MIRQSLESENKEGWQAFDLTGIDQYVALISIVIKGTGSGSPGFKMLNAKIIGNPIENPTGIFYVRIFCHECSEQRRVGHVLSLSFEKVAVSISGRVTATIKNPESRKTAVTQERLHAYAFFNINTPPQT